MYKYIKNHVLLVYLNYCEEPMLGTYSLATFYYTLMFQLEYKVIYVNINQNSTKK